MQTLKSNHKSLMSQALLCTLSILIPGGIKDYFTLVSILTVPILVALQGCISWYIPEGYIDDDVEWPNTAKRRDVLGCTMYILSNHMDTISRLDLWDKVFRWNECRCQISSWRNGLRHTWQSVTLAVETSVENFGACSATFAAWNLQQIKAQLDFWLPGIASSSLGQ